MLDIEKPTMWSLSKINLTGKEPFNGGDKIKNFMASILKKEKIPPICIDANGVILDGLHRWRAYKNLNVENVLVEVWIRNE